MSSAKVGQVGGRNGWVEWNEPHPNGVPGAARSTRPPPPYDFTPMTSQGKPFRGRLKGTAAAAAALLLVCVCVCVYNISLLLRAQFLTMRTSLFFLAVLFSAVAGRPAVGAAEPTRPRGASEAQDRTQPRGQDAGGRAAAVTLPVQRRTSSGGRTTRREISNRRRRPTAPASMQLLHQKTVPWSVLRELLETTITRRRPESRQPPRSRNRRPGRLPPPAHAGAADMTDQKAATAGRAGRSPISRPAQRPPARTLFASRLLLQTPARPRAGGRFRRGERRGVICRGSPATTWPCGNWRPRWSARNLDRGPVDPLVERAEILIVRGKDLQMYGDLVPKPQRASLDRLRSPKTVITQLGDTGSPTPAKPTGGKDSFKGTAGTSVRQSKSGSTVSRSVWRRWRKSNGMKRYLAGAKLGGCPQTLSFHPRR